MGLWKTYNITEAAPNYPQTVHKHEHRAPTDESVKLLRELEKEAQENILKSFHINNNVLNGVVIETMQEVSSYTKKIYVRFSLNGKVFTFCETIEEIDFVVDANHALKLLVDKLTATITHELLDRLIVGALK